MIKKILIGIIGFSWLLFMVMSVIEIISTNSIFGAFTLMFVNIVLCVICATFNIMEMS